MTADKTQLQGALLIGVEVGPVEYHDDFLAFADDVANPDRKYIFNDHTLVTQKPVNLFYCMFVGQIAGICQAMANGVSGQRSACKDTNGCVGQRQNSFCMKIFIEQVVEKSENIFLFDNFFLCIGGLLCPGLSPTAPMKQIPVSAVLKCWIKSITCTENLKYYLRGSLRDP